MTKALKMWQFYIIMAYIINIICIFNILRIIINI